MKLKDDPFAALYGPQRAKRNPYLYNDVDDPVRPDEADRPFMTWRRLPHTEEAILLSNHVANEIIQHEAPRERQRTDLRTIAFFNAVWRTIGDLVFTASTPGKYRSWPKTKAYYDRPDVQERITYPHMKAVYDGLKRCLYIRTFMAGHKAKGVVETVDITAEFRALVAHVSDNPRHHFRVERARLSDLGFAPLQVRAPSEWKHGEKVRSGERLREIEQTPEAIELAQQMQKRNAFVRQAQIEGARCDGFVRIFDGDLTRGGRLYARPADDTGYQNLPKASRLQIVLDGKPCVEIDLVASFLTFALARRGVSLPERVQELGIPDPYTIGGIDRAWVKYYWVAAFGNGKHLRWWPTGHDEEAAKREMPWPPPPVELVRERVQQMYPELASLDGLGWPELQFAESEVVLATMEALREIGRPALPVHDSILVQADIEELVLEMLQDTFRNQEGFKPLPPKTNRP